MLHTGTVEPDTLELLRKIQSLPAFSSTRLVGGTALALQLGHRKSIDLDFFGKIEMSAEDISQELRHVGNVEIMSSSRNINVFFVNGVKVDFVNYPYEWIDDAVKSDGLILASMTDIAPMKISAICNRGTKKDFIDLYFLLQKFKMKEILNLYQKKYTDSSPFIAMKSIVYFNDAEEYPMPVMLKNVSWEEIKRAITNSIKQSQTTTCLKNR